MSGSLTRQQSLARGALLLQKIPWVCEQVPWLQERVLERKQGQVQVPGAGLDRCRGRFKLWEPVLERWEAGSSSGSRF